MALRDNWVAWYSADWGDHLLDNTGKGHVLTPSSGSFPPVESGGVPNRYFQFSGGANDGFATPDAPDLSFTTGIFPNEIDAALTLHGWIKTNSVSASARTIVGKVTEYRLAQFGAQIEFRLNGEGNPAKTLILRTTNAAITTGAWFHVVGVYNGNGTEAGMKIYVNKVEKTTASFSSGDYTHMINTTQPLTIQRVASQDFFTGGLDNIGVRKGITTQAEIDELFNNGNGLNLFPPRGGMMMQFF